jgi:sarcosine oxidase, subunit gamma
MPERVPETNAVIQIAAIEGRTRLRLKSWLAEHALGGKSVRLAGCDLPPHGGTSSTGPMRALCVGPGEWWLVSAGKGSSNLHEPIASAALEQGFALVDLSDGWVGLEVSGSASRDVLSKGCGLDLHPRSFPVGHCARTRFAQIPLVIECPDEPSRFELHVARSYFDYLHSWLIDAAAEWRIPSNSGGSDRSTAVIGR